MSWFAICETNGRIIQTIFVDDSVNLKTVFKDKKIVSISGNLKDIGDYYYDGAEFRMKSERPSIKHVFNYDTKTWVDGRTVDQAWNDVRWDRDKLLAESDWTILVDVPLSEASKTNWMAYRQSLRDITNQANPFNITWPVKPS